MYKITMLYALTILYNYICQLFFNKVKKKSKREKNSSAIIMSQYGAYFLGKEWFSRSLTSVCLGQSFPGVCLAAWRFYSANRRPSLPNKSGKYGFIRAIWDSLELLVCSNVQPYLWEGLEDVLFPPFNGHRRLLFMEHFMRPVFQNRNLEEIW